MNTSTWQPLAPDVVAFLDKFDRRRDSDTDSGELYAEQFLTLAPNSAATVTRAALVAALPARRQLFAKAGIGPVRRRAASQLDLDPKHVLVRTQWDAERGDDQPVALESTFLLRRDADGVHIVVYLNHHDVAARLSRADSAT